MEATPREDSVEGIFRDRSHEDTPAADRLRPDDQPALGRRADDPGARAQPSLQGARDRHRPGYQAAVSPGSPAGSIPSSGISRWRCAQPVQRLEPAPSPWCWRRLPLGLPEQAPFPTGSCSPPPPRIAQDAARPAAPGRDHGPAGRPEQRSDRIKVKNKTEKGLDYTDLGAVRFVPFVEVAWQRMYWIGAAHLNLGRARCASPAKPRPPGRVGRRSPQCCLGLALRSAAAAAPTPIRSITGPTGPAAP